MPFCFHFSANLLLDQYKFNTEINWILQFQNECNKLVIKLRVVLNFGLKSYLWFEIELALRSRPIFKHEYHFRQNCTLLSSITIINYAILGSITIINYIPLGSITIINYIPLGSITIISKTLLKDSFAGAWLKRKGQKLESAQQTVIGENCHRLRFVDTLESDGFFCFFKTLCVIVSTFIKSF